MSEIPSAARRAHARRGATASAAVRLCARARAHEGGFSLLELLVTMLILGILVAVGIGIFEGQRAKALDTSAKADVRALVVIADSCFLETSDYTKCDEPSELDALGLPLASGSGTPPEGQVAVAIAVEDGYSIQSRSKSGTVFEAVKVLPSDTLTRNCDRPGEGGCPQEGKW